MTEPEPSDWACLKSIATIDSPWVTVYAEQWRDDTGALLDYWRVERPDSVIVIPVHKGRFLLPPSVFRPGLGRKTLDFPGGRLPEGQAPESVVPRLLKRELGIPTASIRRIAPINQVGWPVDSSFSSQRLWGFTADIAATFELGPEQVGSSYPADNGGAESLLEQLECLQCRCLLLQWLARLVQTP